MRSNRSSVLETIRHKRKWHTPPNREAAKLGFRSWHSRGYLPHFDMPGLVQFINYRLEDAMPANLRHEWATLLAINDELRRRTKIEEYLDRGTAAVVYFVIQAQRELSRQTGLSLTGSAIACSLGL
jgi:hypothetical protein